jgi:hypothetical protein
VRETRLHAKARVRAHIRARARAHTHTHCLNLSNLDSQIHPYSPARTCFSLPSLAHLFPPRSYRGIVVRQKHQSSWEAGEESERDEVKRYMIRIIIITINSNNV